MKYRLCARIEDVADKLCELMRHVGACWVMRAWLTTRLGRWYSDEYARRELADSDSHHYDEWA